MKDLAKIIRDIPLDKKEHIIVGVIYSAFIPILGFFLGDLGVLIALTVGTGLNLYKEVYNDLFKEEGNAEFLDFLATQAPIIITTLAYLMR